MAGSLKLSCSASAASCAESGREALAAFSIGLSLLTRALVVMGAGVARLV